MTEFIIKVNKLKNCYVTDGNIWTVDETFFTNEICLFLVTNLKTRVILGYILGHKEAKSFYILELYRKILLTYKVGQNPLFIHSDLKEEYYKSKEIIRFFEEEKIQLSLASGNKHQNQVSESINDKIKYETILYLISKDMRLLRALIKTQFSIFKGKNNKNKARARSYRKWFFNTNFFKQHAFSAIQKAILNLTEV